MAPRHLVMFAKLPRIGRVKSRLAADIGPVPAWCFCRTVTRSLLKGLAAPRRWCCWLALERWGERGGHCGLASRGWTRLEQGRGDLGQRMERVLCVLPPGPVVIIGSDVPDLVPAHIEKAFAALHDCDAVFGPAVDGGFWLVGVQSKSRRLPLFEQVRWSTRYTLSDTLANLPRQTVAVIDLLEDIDYGPAYQRWLQRRRQRGVRSSAAGVSA
ncbi:MAG: DUF2064 domain-containing protein [Defluviicoccus sp.]|nr:DUF2064 domain-containing protein [Defluviicoccus sp.]MDG4609752.1 DUF2064 domain-containing protein [Defluviicoccus sp.]